MCISFRLLRLKIDFGAQNLLFLVNFVNELTLQESSAGKNTRKKFSSRIYLRAGQFKARKKFSSLM